MNPNEVENIFDKYINNPLHWWLLIPSWIIAAFVFIFAAGTDGQDYRGETVRDPLPLHHFVSDIFPFMMIPTGLVLLNIVILMVRSGREKK